MLSNLFSFFFYSLFHIIVLCFSLKWAILVNVNIGPQLNLSILLFYKYRLKSPECIERVLLLTEGLMSTNLNPTTFTAFRIGNLQ